MCKMVNYNGMASKLFLLEFLGFVTSIVNQLEKSVGKDANAESRLTKIYVDLGKDLELQIEGLAEAGNEAAKKALVDAFEMFLERIKKSPAPSVAGELAKLGVTEPPQNAWLSGGSCAIGASTGASSATSRLHRSS